LLLFFECMWLLTLLGMLVVLLCLYYSSRTCWLFDVSYMHLEVSC
jgi:hypothetical protein